MIYLISDLHIGHENILKTCQRPFFNVEEMNRTLIRNWNKIINDKDTVYILGDFFFKIPLVEANGIIKNLKGKKILIKGNHDLDYDKSLFVEICDFKVIKYHKRKFVLMHYPMLEWPYSFQGGIHLHGHQHNTSEYNERMRKEGILRYDVGVDANGFQPIPIEDIINFIDEEMI